MAAANQAPADLLKRAGERQHATAAQVEFRLMSSVKPQPSDRASLRARDRRHSAQNGRPAKSVLNACSRSANCRTRSACSARACAISDRYACAAAKRFWVSVFNKAVLPRIHGGDQVRAALPDRTSNRTWTKTRTAGASRVLLKATPPWPPRRRAWSSDVKS